MKRSAVMFIAIGGPKAHVTLSMTGTPFHQLVRICDAARILKGKRGKGQGQRVKDKG